MTDHVLILKALQAIPFSVGRTFLVDFLQGISTDSICKCRLYKSPYFGCLAYEKPELTTLIAKLQQAGFITLVKSPKNPFWKLLAITGKGEKEILNPTWHTKSQIKAIPIEKISPDEREELSQIAELSDYDISQRKAIISEKQNILCVAGAGSGKTRVLTKRIQ
ncbi:MAG: UvrD-helicase domain-containing protein, partial [Candidatus Woesearchaeota archaeon]